MNAYTIRGTKYPRIRFGDEGLGWGATACRDCGAEAGQYHVPDCEYEECPACGELVASGHPCEFDELMASSERPGVALLREPPFLGRLERVLVRLGAALIAGVAVWAVWWLSSQGLFAREERAVFGGPKSGLPIPYEEGLPRFEDMKKRAEDGDARAAYLLATYYTREIPDARDRRAWLEKAAAAGHPPACYHLGIRLLDEGRLQEAVINLKIARDDGTDEIEREFSGRAGQVLLEIENAQAAPSRKRAAAMK